MFEFARLYARLGELSETGVDATVRAPLGERSFEHRARALDARPGTLGERNLRPAIENVPPQYLGGATRRAHAVRD